MAAGWRSPGARRAGRAPRRPARDPCCRSSASASTRTGRRADVGDRVDRRDERERRDQDVVAGPDVEHPQREVDRRRAAGAGDRVARPDGRREFVARTARRTGPTDETKFVSQALLEVGGRVAADRAARRAGCGAPCQSWTRSGVAASAGCVRSQSIVAREAVLQARLAPPSRGAPARSDGSDWSDEHLARVGPQAGRVLDDRRVAPGQRPRAIANSSPIDSLRPGARAGSSSPSIPGAVAARTKPSTVSATKVRSRRGVEAAEADLVWPGQELAEHRRQHRAVGLARTVRVERPQDDDRDAEAAVEGQRELVGGDLRGGVRRLRVERMRLADRQRLGRAVDLARRGLDDPPDACAGGPPRATLSVPDDVGVDERLRRRRTSTGSR